MKIIILFIVFYLGYIDYNHTFASEKQTKCINYE